MKAKSELRNRVNAKQRQLRAKRARYDNAHYQLQERARIWRLCGKPIRLIDKRKWA